MKKEYDFSKDVKGKFYIPENEIQLPIYLRAPRITQFSFKLDLFPSYFFDRNVI